MTFKKMLIALLGWLPVWMLAQLPAFPGAEGFGKNARGGRGGEVYHVTSLNDSGPGTLRDAVSRPHRTVLFDVSGVIRLRSRLVLSSFVTVAGQSAPGEGIVVYGNGVSMTGATDVVMRYIRLRGSIAMGRGVCTLSADEAKDIIFDHVSVEWGRWDNLHIKESDRVTVQHCLIGEGIDPQKFGALLENPTHLTIYRCLWVDNQSRNPKAKAGIEVVNNVIYNWGSNGLVGGHSGADHFQDIVGNYFVAGPNSSQAFIGMFSATDHVYHQGNKVDLNKDGVLNGRAVCDSDFVRCTATLAADRQNQSVTHIADAATIFREVTAQCGDLLHRDAIDTRLIGYVRSLGKAGIIIKSETEVGGQPDLKQANAPKDTDADGMPDEWEKAHGLNPRNASDGNKTNAEGYTNLELYLNSLVGQHE